MLFMLWLDVAGPPGVGKSAICDPLWHPRAIEWDGKGYPVEWQTFVAVVDRLLTRIERHPSGRKCGRIVERSLRKIATVSRLRRDGVYVQTGIAQRALGIGWRLGDDVDAIADYYLTMPVSVGVVFLTAPVNVVQERNVSRGKDRAWMVPLVEESMGIGRAILRDRGVPVLELDTRNPVADNIASIKRFVGLSADVADAAAA
jgi:hypothetical protein